MMMESMKGEKREEKWRFGMVNGDGGDERGKREEKGRFGMVNGDEGNKRGEKGGFVWWMLMKGMKGEKGAEKGMFGMINDDGRDKRGKGENERLPLVWWMVM
jgi:hypothetical protein